MTIKQSAQAGTFESSDILVMIEPVAENAGRKIEISSIVMLQYGNEIKNLIEKILDEYKISDIHIVAKDKGALDATIAARVETAIKRSLDLQEGTSWVKQ